jgi:hypothetical protein
VEEIKVFGHNRSIASANGYLMFSDFKIMLGIGGYFSLGDNK